jgi:hypothetical protein|tara:strand:- start:48 stop:392 length:345 start_codon:yes stop_codon:yes gene_type:complete
MKPKRKDWHQRQGRRNRQRGAELQRQIVKLAKTHGLEAYNRDRGGAQHEQGDLEIHGNYWGCKRHKRIAKWLYPEKKEYGVFFREDRGIPMVSIPAELLMELMCGFLDKIESNK